MLWQVTSPKSKSELLWQVEHGGEFFHARTEAFSPDWMKPTHSMEDNLLSSETPLPQLKCTYPPGILMETSRVCLILGVVTQPSQHMKSSHLTWQMHFCVWGQHRSDGQKRLLRKGQLNQAWWMDWPHDTCSPCIMSPRMGWELCPMAVSQQPP